MTPIAAKLRNRLFGGVLVLLALALNVAAFTYYVSESGNDANSAPQARNAATPWKTLGAVQSAIDSSVFAGGDIIAFERGSTFYGLLNFGTKLRNITLTAYGDSSRPLPHFMGSAPITTGWTVHSGSIFKTTLAAFTSVKMVYADGEPMVRARWPNRAPVAGSTAFSRFTATDSVAKTWSDSSAPVKPSGYWNGATVKYRATNWSYASALVNYTVPSGAGLFTVLNTPTDQYPDVNYGYWLEGLLSELDAEGEWHFDSATKILYFWAPGSVNPSTISVTVIGDPIGSAISGTDSRDATIEKIHFSYYSGGVSIRSSAGNSSVNGPVSIRNSQFDHIYGNGIHVVDLTRGGDISNNYLVRRPTTCFGHGMQIDGYSRNVRIHQNTLWDVGLEPSEGCQGTNQCGAGMWIQSRTQYIVASENHIDRVGYTGITFMGYRHLITRNLVKRALWALNDGGGIYAYGNYSQGTSLTWNIVSETRGNLDGAAGSTRLDVCLYFDDWCNAAYVAYNTFYNCHRSIFVHDSRDMIIENNLFFNSSFIQLWIFEQNSNPGTYLMTKNNTVRNNVIYNGQKNQELVREDTDFDRTDLFAQYSNNLLCSPYESGPYGSFGAQMNPITRQQNTRFCSRKQNLFTISNVLSQTSLVNGNWSSSSTTNGWSAGNPSQNSSLALVTDSVACGTQQKCIKWTLPPCCYTPITYASMSSNAAFTILANQSYLVEGEVYSTVYGSFDLVPLNRAAYNAKASAIRVGVLPNQAVPIYGIWSPGSDDTNVRLEFRSRVALKELWVRWIKVRPVVSAPSPAKELLLTNPTNQTTTISLPNGQQYVDVEDNLVTYTIDLQPYGSALLFDQGYNASLLRPPTSAPISTGTSPSATGGSPAGGTQAPSQQSSPKATSSQPSSSSPGSDSVNSSSSSLAMNITFLAFAFFAATVVLFM